MEIQTLPLCLIEPAAFTADSCHTWRRGNCLSKLDYVYVSHSLATNIAKAELLWYEFGALFDHAALRVKFQGSSGTLRGRSFPKIFKTDISTEQDKMWLAEQIRHCEAQIPPHWNPHMRLDFIKTTLRSKTLELRQMNARNHLSTNQGPVPAHLGRDPEGLSGHRGPPDHQVGEDGDPENAADEGDGIQLAR